MGLRWAAAEFAGPGRQRPVILERPDVGFMVGAVSVLCKAAANRAKRGYEAFWALYPLFKFMPACGLGYSHGQVEWGWFSIYTVQSPFPAWPRPVLPTG